MDVAQILAAQSIGGVVSSSSVTPVKSKQKLISLCSYKRIKYCDVSVKRNSYVNTNVKIALNALENKV